MNQEGKALHPVHLAAELYKTNLFYIYIKIDIIVPVPAENGGPKKQKGLQNKTKNNKHLEHQNYSVLLS